MRIIKNVLYNNFIAIFAFEIVNTFNRNRMKEPWNDTCIFPDGPFRPFGPPCGYYYRINL